MNTAQAKQTSLFDEIQRENEEIKNRAEELAMHKSGKSAKVNVYSEKYWEEYSQKTDRHSKRVYAVHQMLSSTKFDMSIGVVIMMNSITIGVQMEFELQNKDVSALLLIDNVFLGIYAVELGLRFFAYGIHCLDNGWVQFDAALVTLGLGTSILEIGLGAEFLENLGPIMVLRVLRLLRLARAVRLFSQFKALWMLVRGLLSSAGTMSYTFLLMVLIFYLFANMAIELITKDQALRDKEPEYDQLVLQFFPNLATTMLTLVQFATLDSIGAIYGGMIPHKPVTLSVFFILFILVVSISLMNLVTAVIVEGSLDQASADKEVNSAYKAAEMKKLIPQIKELFIKMDADQSGELELDEVLNADIETQEELAKVMEMDDLQELFEILDIDSSGSLGIDEFVEGITKLITSDAPKETLRMQKSLNIVRNDVKDVVFYAKDMEDNLRRDIREGFLRLHRKLEPLPHQDPKKELNPRISRLSKSSTSLNSPKVTKSSTLPPVDSQILESRESFDSQ
jgi:voltage-gated sodium channel